MHLLKFVVCQSSRYFFSGKPKYIETFVVLALSSSFSEYANGSSPQDDLTSGVITVHQRGSVETSLYLQSILVSLLA